MPQSDGHKRRTLDEEPFQPNAPSPFVELGLASCFSFLRASSDAVDLSVAANTLGYDAMGIADHNTLAGVVRVHIEAKKACVRPLIGSRLVLMCGAEFLAYPRDRDAYARSVAELLKLKGEIVVVDPGTLPKDGLVIEDQRSYD